MSRMRTSWIIVANIAVMAAILVFVALYSNHEKKEHYHNQVEHFVNTTIAMERVTGNYMVGEQGICDNWAKYINSRDLTLEEATDYVRATHVSESTSAHLIDAESLKGYSTRPRPNTEDGYEVSYERMDLFGDGAWIADLGEAVNITRTYTNPVNGEQSLAFCNRITVRDEESGEKKQAYLLRIVPVSNLEEKWVFPQEEYEHEEFSIIDNESNYVIKGRSFKNASFFEFYKSYNQPGIAEQQQLFADIEQGMPGRPYPHHVHEGLGAAELGTGQRPEGGCGELAPDRGHHLRTAAAAGDGLSVHASDQSEAAGHGQGSGRCQ